MGLTNYKLRTVKDVIIPISVEKLSNDKFKIYFSNGMADLWTVIMNIIQ